MAVTRRGAKVASSAGNIASDRTSSEYHDYVAAKRYREEFLERSRNGKSSLGSAIRSLEILRIRFEVSIGAHMFGKTEKVIFYVSFLLILYLICSSMVHYIKISI